MLGRLRTAAIWPRRIPPAATDGERAARLALEVRRGLLGVHHTAEPLRDLRAACRAAGASYAQTELGGADGTIQALLIPLERNRFAIRVDPTPPGGWDAVPAHLRAEVRRHRLRFRVCHELGHTFFYARDGGRPRLAVAASPRQEEFCDAFGRSLLVSPIATARTAPTAEAIVLAARHFDVSLQLAARAFGDAHPGARIGLWWWPADGPPVTQWCSQEGSLCPEEERWRAGRSSSRVQWLAGRRQLLSVTG